MHAPLKKTPAKQNLIQRLLKIEYFVIALLMHLVLLVGFGGKVLFDAVTRKSAFEPGTFITSGGDATPAPPPSAVETPPEVEVVVPVTSNTSTEVISTDIMNSSTFTIAPPTITPTTLPPTENIVQQTSTTQAAIPKAKSFDKRAADIREFQKAWGLGGSGGGGRPQYGKDLHATFVCYLAKGGGVDPSDYHVVVNNKLTAGPIPNLLYMINQWSHDNIKAQAVPEPLELSSNGLFEKKPPFIYFAGYKDFVLSQAEIENLRRYLMSGGAIWGDNGLAGLGSRFDIAFRREMKRVIPDEDKPFEKLPPDHPIYRGDHAFFQLKGQPPGMNYRNEPMEVIRIDDEIAVLYTPNNYTDMMQMVYKRPVKLVDNLPDAPPPYAAEAKARPWTTGRNWYMLRLDSAAYFRNFDVSSTELAFQFGINIINHLLTRFQEKLLLAP